MEPFHYAYHNHVSPQPGLYCFWLRTRCLYVGMSEDLQRRMAQHCTAEDNPKLARHFQTYSEEIRVSITYLDMPASRLRHIESRIISTLKPICNRRGIP